MQYIRIELKDIIEFEAPEKRTGEVGHIYPILVRPVKDKFEVVDGHGRVLDAINREEDHIFALVEPMSDVKARASSLAANLSIRPNPMQLAQDIAALMKGDRSNEPMTQEEIAKFTGVAQPTISRLHTLNRLPIFLQKLLKTGEMKKSAGFIALDLTPENQELLAQTPTMAEASRLRDLQNSATLDLGSAVRQQREIEQRRNPQQNLTISADLLEGLEDGPIQVEWYGVMIQLEMIG